jgi:hypothetical protein
MGEPEIKENGHGGQRLIRLLIIGLIAGVVVLIAKNAGGLKFDLGSQTSKFSSQLFGQIGLEKSLVSVSEKILGEEVKLKNEADGEIEPIAEPVNDIQNQTQTLLDSIKKLPEDQLKAVKKQLYKEFCEQLKE